MSLRFYAGFVCLVGFSLLLGGKSTETGRPCDYEGYHANSGDIFVMPSISGKCITYFCNDSSFFPKDYKCERNDGSCHPLNDSYTEGCFTYNCQSSGGYIQYVLVKEACGYNDGDDEKCLPVDETVSLGCQKYKCVKEVDGQSTSYSFEDAGSECPYQGKCVAVGQTVKDGCNKYQCVKTDDGTVTTKIVEEGCPHSNSCISVGTTAQFNCTSYLCSKQVNSGTTTYTASIQEQKCEDANHKCQTPGSFFPYKINGVVRPNCTCEIKLPSTKSYRCYENAKQ
ncbi:hypothetical protein BsWGS_06651 [Bradybaena similaris]